MCYDNRYKLISLRSKAKQYLLPKNSDKLTSSSPAGAVLMNTPETEHQTRIKQIIEEGDRQYLAELERQSELAEEDLDPEPVITPVTKEDSDS